VRVSKENLEAVVGVNRLLFLADYVDQVQAAIPSPNDP
jgi:hypothetical protein